MAYCKVQASIFESCGNRVQSFTRGAEAVCSQGRDLGGKQIAVALLDRGTGFGLMRACRQRLDTSSQAAKQNEIGSAAVIRPRAVSARQAARSFRYVAHAVFLVLKTTKAVRFTFRAQIAFWNTSGAAEP